MTHYGRSPWLSRFPKSRVPAYPRHRGHLETDVAVVGGGLTGCTIAYAFAAAGIKVALVEAEQIGRGGTAGAAGWLSDEPGAPFVDIEKAIGLRSARRAWQAWHRAALDFAALLRRLDVRCYLDPRPTVTVALTPDQLARLRRERKVRREAGIEVPFVNARTVSAEIAVAGSGLRTRDSATLDPYRAALGLAAAAIDRGAHVFERSPVTKTTFGRRAVDIRTAHGSIRADRVVVATGLPTRLFKSLIRHFWFRTTYLALTDRVPARVRQQLGRRQAIVRDAASPPHVIRWLDDDRLLVMGADSASPPARQLQKTVVQRTGQLMYELSTLYPDISGIPPEYGWDASYGWTGDGLPYIGPHRNIPRHLFAFGDSSHSVTGAYLASRILLRHYLDEVEPADQVFAFTRYGR
jgi:glycine/D-amino acid oxidase-like deaminating enzyme